jgi:hypothetical protein
MPAAQEASERVEGNAVGIGRLMVYRQLVLTLLLVVLFWILYVRLYKQEFFRWWGLAATSFAAYLGITALLLHLAPEWTLLKSSLILFSVLARFFQIPFLRFLLHGACAHKRYACADG